MLKSREWRKHRAHNGCHLFRCRLDYVFCAFYLVFLLLMRMPLNSMHDPLAIRHLAHKGLSLLNVKCRERATIAAGERSEAAAAFC